MLPLNVSLDGARIVRSTAEIAEVKQTRITFRPIRADHVIVLETDRKIDPADSFSIRREANRLVITSCKHAAPDKELAVS